MRTTIRQTTPRRTERRPAHPVQRPAAPAPAATAEQRVRDEGGPRDLALYSCGCGCTFDGAVSTTVACPRCGDGQAW